MKQIELKAFKTTTDPKLHAIEHHQEQRAELVEFVSGVKSANDIEHLLVEDGYIRSLDGTHAYHHEIIFLYCMNIKPAKPALSFREAIFSDGTRLLFKVVDGQVAAFIKEPGEE